MPTLHRCCARDVTHPSSSSPPPIRQTALEVSPDGSGGLTASRRRPGRETAIGASRRHNGGCCDGGRLSEVHSIHKNKQRINNPVKGEQKSKEQSGNPRVIVEEQMVSRPSETEIGGEKQVKGFSFAQEKATIVDEEPSLLSKAKSGEVFEAEKGRQNTGTTRPLPVRQNAPMNRAIPNTEGRPARPRNAWSNVSNTKQGPNQGPSASFSSLFTRDVSKCPGNVFGGLPQPTISEKLPRNHRGHLSIRFGKTEVGQLNAIENHLLIVFLNSYCT
ncbi:PREDICTED: uncharacterized protein LOC109166654 isoform X1 [Ipomoea nil]|uniref:uncharacterized protein LOC109166654 isoform X1 n=1 Tax=Ipomoea nil TaxID=35883 RepID=UPI000901EDBF|nr:PREDICTED: uncharacterized protein LOC109166654 isoform X1 [Ipomoea nil]